MFFKTNHIDGNKTFKVELVLKNDTMFLLVREDNLWPVTAYPNWIPQGSMQKESVHVDKHDTLVLE
jgi:hypothetical protein